MFSLGKRINVKQENRTATTDEIIVENENNKLKVRKMWKLLFLNEWINAVGGFVILKYTKNYIYVHLEPCSLQDKKFIIMILIQIPTYF